MGIKQKMLLVACSILVGQLLYAQDVDLDKLLAEEAAKAEKKVPAATVATFKTTRISNGHSVETLPAGVLDLKIQHRFGSLSDGIKNFFGLDQATIRIGLDYGVTNKLMVGFGRATFQKQIDAFAKYKILEQKAESGMPVSVAALASGMVRTDDYDNGLSYTPYFTDRLSYALQLMVARKFSDGVSLQLMPTMVHYNIVPKTADPNDIISIGVGGRFKITKRSSFNIEYYYNLPGNRFDGTKNSLALGFDIETGGHVFQLIFTNGQGIAERPFITETTGDFFSGDIHFGFNISRSFQVGKGKSGKKGKW